VIIRNIVSRTLVVIAFGAACAASLAASAQTPAACDRACLKGFADQYLDALLKHDPKPLPVARNLKATENGAPLKLGEGFWRTAAAGNGYRIYVIDLETGGAAVQAVLSENGELALFLLRLRIEERKIAEVETIIARKGVASGAIWAPETLKTPSEFFTTPLRRAEQNSRLELMAAADAYFRAFETNGTPDYHPAPFLPNTNRWENGMQTTNKKAGNFGPYTASEQFDRGLFPGRAFRDRRYPVVDTETGVVLSIVRFGRQPGAKGSPNVPDNVEPIGAEIFSVRKGFIQEIQVVMTLLPPNTPTGW
jgi:hypothetical protein